jgi:HlyD family secretion protein
MSEKTQHNNILLAVVGFVAVVIIVALIGFFALDRDPDIMQGQVEVSEYRVSSKVPGRILELRVKEGDYVKAGDTLAILDAPEVRAKMEQARSAENAASALELKAQNGARKEQIQGAFSVLQQAKAGLEIAEKSYNRVQRLFDEGVISAQKRDEAYANYKAMEAQCKAAQSQYDMAVNGARMEDKLAAAAQVGRAKGAVNEVNSYINETVQIAQMEGEVSDVYPKVGELVGTGSPIMPIAVMPWPTGRKLISWISSSRRYFSSRSFTETKPVTTFPSASRNQTLMVPCLVNFVAMSRKTSLVVEKTRVSASRFSALNTSVCLTVAT